MGDSNPKGNPERPRESKASGSAQRIVLPIRELGPHPAPQGCQGAGQRCAVQHDLSAGGGGVFLEATGYGQSRK